MFTVTVKVIHEDSLFCNFTIQSIKENKNSHLNIPLVHSPINQASSFTEETWYGSGSGSGDGAFTDDEDGFKEGSGYEDSRAESEPESPKQPPPTIVHEVETPPRVDIEPHKGTGNQTTTADSGSASRQKMTLFRALTTYLVPIVVMWFGGCFTELLWSCGPCDLAM